MCTRICLAAILAHLILLGPFSASGQVPRTLSWQGILNEATGSHVPDRAYSVTFHLYETAFGGVPLFSETQTLDAVGGVVSAVIGSSTGIPASVSFDRQYFLALAIDGGAEMQPRMPLTTAPYSLQAERSVSSVHASSADTATVAGTLVGGAVTRINGRQGDVSILGTGGVTVSSSGNSITIHSSVSNPWTSSSNDISYSGGNVGIGTTSPATALDVDGTVRAGQFQMTTGAGSGRFLVSDATGKAEWTTRIVAKGANVLVGNGLGIGIPDTVNPRARLHAMTNFSGFAPIASRTAILEGSATASLSLRTDSVGRARIYFERPIGAGGSVIQSDSSLIVFGRHRFTANNSTTQSYRFYFDNEVGRFGVGRYAAENNLEVSGNASKTTAGDWLANSDRRIKTDVKTVENATETLMRIRPVTFRYTDEWMARHPEIENRTYYNVIAQEYAQVFPHAVKGSGEYLENDPDEVLQVDTYDAQVVTMKAVQELIEMNRRLRTELDELRRRLDAREGDTGR